MWRPIYCQHRSPTGLGVLLHKFVLPLASGDECNGLVVPGQSIPDICANTGRVHTYMVLANGHANLDAIGRNPWCANKRPEWVPSCLVGSLDNTESIDSTWILPTEFLYWQRVVVV